jgi:hypothetical protein
VPVRGALVHTAVCIHGIFLVSAVEMRAMALLNGSEALRQIGLICPTPQTQTCGICPSRRSVQSYAEISLLPSTKRFFCRK